MGLSYHSAACAHHRARAAAYRAKAERHHARAEAHRIQFGDGRVLAFIHATSPPVIERALIAFRKVDRRKDPQLKNQLEVRHRVMEKLKHMGWDTFEMKASEPADDLYNELGHHPDIRKTWGELLIEVSQED